MTGTGGDLPLEHLLVLQELDTTLEQLRYRRAHLEERSELAGLDASLADLADQRRAVEAALEDVVSRQVGVEADLAAAEERSAGLTRRMYAGEVSAARDLQAMSEEVEHLKVRISSFEDSVLELMEEREPLDARSADLGASAERITGQREGTAARLGRSEADLDAEIAVAAERRSQAAEAVPPALLSEYDRLRSRLGGVGVARLVSGRCDGCHLTLPAAELDKVRHLAEGELYHCEQCSRILVP